MKSLLAKTVFVTACLCSWTYSLSPIYAQYAEQSQSIREVVELSQKKHIKPEHIKGLDTYDNPIDYYVKEEFIFRFKDRNGFFTVSKKVFDSAKVGNKFVVENDELYYCRRTDGCYD